MNLRLLDVVESHLPDGTHVDATRFVHAGTLYEVITVTRTRPAAYIGPYESVDPKMLAEQVENETRRIAGA